MDGLQTAHGCSQLLYYVYTTSSVVFSYYTNTKLQVSAILLQKQHEHIAVVAAISFFFKYYIKVHLSCFPLLYPNQVMILDDIDRQLFRKLED